MADLAAALRDESVTARLATDGFAVVDLLGPEATARLLTLVAGFGPAPGDGGVVRFPSWASRVPAYGDRVAELLASELELGVELVDSSAVTCLGALVVWPGPGSGEAPHRVGDGPTGPGLRIELSLTDVSPDAGPTWVAGADGAPMPVALRAGQALVLRCGLTVAAGPSDDRPRHVLVLTAPDPVDAPMESARSDAWPDPGDRRCAGCADPLAEAGVDARVGVPEWCAECLAEAVADVVAVARVTSSGPRPSPAPDTLPDRGDPVLRDPMLDDQLRRDGFVVLPEPVITRAEAADLSRRFDELHRWQGHGHLNDFNHRNLAYRRAGDEAMRSALGAAIDGVFVDHEPFLATFLCKFPGEDSELEVHQDWTYVDETQGERSFAAFVALSDIDGHNGQIRILRGSHRFDPTVRGTGLRAPWLNHTEVLEQHLESLPMQAGQCAVWNSATAHASFPNLTDERRLAATLWMARRGAPLVHWKRTSAGAATGFLIDESFYDTHNPFRLMAYDPAFPQFAAVEVVDRLVSPAALEAAIAATRPTVADRVRHRLRREVLKGPLVSSKGPWRHRSTP